MSCLSVLQCSLYIDNELEGAARSTAQQHIASCAACQSRIAYLQNEVIAVRSALHLSAKSAAPVAAPALVTRPKLSRSALWFVSLLIFVWATSAAWVTVSSALSLPQWLSWPLPSSTGVGIDLLRGLSSDWLGSLAEMISDLLLAALAIGALWFLAPKRTTATNNTGLGIAACVLLTSFAPDSQAFELRRDEFNVEVAAAETINDTLIVGAERVDVNGTINGDLVVVGERVTVRGNVTGSIYGAAEELTLEGSVTGNVLLVGENIKTRGANIGGNIYTGGESVSVLRETTISGNALMMGEELLIEGTIDRDLVTAGEQTRLGGAVAGDMRTYGKSATLTGGASVGGNLTGILETPENLNVSAEATVAGTTNATGWPEDEDDDSIWGDFMKVAMQIVAAALFGLLLFVMFPALRMRQLIGGGEYLGAALLGGGALIGLPILAIMVTATLIGAPIGIATLLLWLTGLYASGIVAANYAGNLLLNEAEHGWVKPLLLGIVLLIVLIQIPFLGSAVRIAAMLLGFGLIAQWLIDQWRMRAI